MDIEQYIMHLISSPDGNSCVKAGSVLQVSHDQVNRLLTNHQFHGKDLFDQASRHLKLCGGVLSVDDSVLDKPYSSLEANELVGRFWSGKHHKVVKGVNLVALVYTDTAGYSLPVHFALYNPEEGLTKHDLFQKMVRQVIGWGLRPQWLTADSWYASANNLKFLRSMELGFIVGLKSDRTVSLQKGEHQAVGQIDAIPTDGVRVHLRKFGFIKLFRTVDERGKTRHYAVYTAEPKDLQRLERQRFKQIKKIHWNIELLFRALKQVCNLERFFVRKAQAVTNHVYGALRAFQRLYAWCSDQLFPSIYAVRNCIYLSAQREFIKQMTA